MKKGVVGAKDVKAALLKLVGKGGHCDTMSLCFQIMNDTEKPIDQVLEALFLKRLRGKPLYKYAFRNKNKGWWSLPLKEQLSCTLFEDIPDVTIPLRLVKEKVNAIK